MTDPERDAGRLAEVLKFVLATRLVDRYDGDTERRNLNYEERLWYEENGIAPPSDFREARSKERVGKQAVMEAFYVDYSIQKAICTIPMSAGMIYQCAAEQLQYETLPMAGMRAVESRGAKLSECRTALGREMAAKQHHGLRARLAAALGISLSAVNERFDEFCKARETGNALTLAQYMGLPTIPTFQTEQQGNIDAHHA